MIVIGADTHKQLAHRRAQSMLRPAACSPTGRSRPSGDPSTSCCDGRAAWAPNASGRSRTAATSPARWSAFCCAAANGSCAWPPKLTAGARRSARERGKSDAIDAVAIARAALREGLDTLPVAQLAGPRARCPLARRSPRAARRQRTALINDLRWHLHDRWPELEIPPRALTTARWQDRVAGPPRARRADRARADRARRAASHPRAHPLIDALERELAVLVAELAPQLLAERRLRRADRRQADRRDRRHRALRHRRQARAHRRLRTDPRLIRTTPPATASIAAATASSTARCTASRSPRAAWTPTPPPTSPASRPTARAAAKRCAASNATSPAASGDSYNPRPADQPASRNARHRRRRIMIYCNTPTAASP